MVQELSPEQIQQVLQGISVPPQPQIMVDLQMEQFMPNPDLKSIAKLISQDPGLSGALLKIVNSPYFGLANKVSSIQRAVNLLGSRSVINMINALSIKGEMSDETIVTLNRFWDTAQAWRVEHTVPSAGCSYSTSITGVRALMPAPANAWKNQSPSRLW